MDYERYVGGLGAIFRPTGGGDAELASIKRFYAPIKGRRGNQIGLN